MPEAFPPHDRFFRISFARPDVAADLILRYLPAELAAALDLTSLDLQEGSFVDEDLRQQQADLLYTVETQDGGRARVYLLFEHKSQPDPLVAFHLLRYCLRIWEREQRAEPGARLPPIVPVAVYNGARPWSVARNVRELVDGPEPLRRHGPDFGFELIDLAARPEDEIVGEVRLRVALLALKLLRRPDAGRQLPRLAKLLRDVAERIALPERGGGSVASLIEQWKAEAL